MRNFEIAVAAKEDVLNIVDLIYCTENTPEFEWGLGSEEILKERLHDLILTPGNRFSLDNILVCKCNNNFAGIVLSIGGKRIKFQTLKADFRLIAKQNTIKDKLLFLMFTLLYIPYLECLPSEYYISNIALLKEYRGDGLAEKLLYECYQNALSLGYNKVSLHANNSNLIKYYERLGFKLTNTKNNKMTKFILH